MSVPAAANERPDERAARLAVWCIAAIGVGLLTWQYAAGASLWIDELAIAQNVVERSWGQLLRAPLRYYQVAPLGFLAPEKAAVTLLGTSDRAFRAVPFLSAIAALLLFTVVALRALPARAAMVAVTLIALAGRLVWNGSQAKQYATDVLATVVIVWVVQRWLADRSGRRTRHAVLAGVVLPFVSQPSAFVLAGGALAIIIALWSVAEWSVRRRGTLVIGSWCAAAVVAAAVHRARVTPETMSLMREYWASGFAPFPPRTLRDVAWPWRALGDLFGATLALRGAALYVVLAIAGAVILSLRSSLGAVVVTPLVLAMVASAARLFPFADRPVVFALPLLALALAAGAEWVAGTLGARRPVLAFATCATLLVAPVASIVRRPPVYRVQDIEPLLEALAKARQDGDGAYVYYGAGPAVRHYAPRLAIPVDGVVLGECHRGDTRAYLRELDPLRGHRRVWVIFSHAEPGLGERETIIGYLDAIGTRLFAASAPAPYVASVASSDVSLYDLSDPTKLGSMDATTAPVAPPRTPIDPRRACRGPFAG